MTNQMANRSRLALTERVGPFGGPVEADETCMCGKRRNMSNTQRRELGGTGRGAVGKTTVVGARDRETNRVAAKVESTDKERLQGYVSDHADSEATV
ncbi:MAG: transposase [Bryobacterales bacterium]|nr:transposase [Bryobacterales bacterium]